jgi:predicted  nucleic acid-binding Zn-ribbon protein
MVMRPDPRVGALTRVKRRNFGPWWLWAIVVVLAGGATYSTLDARKSGLRSAQTDVVRAALEDDNARLRASADELKRNFEDAAGRLRKEHADAEAVTALLAKMQKRVNELQAELTAAREEAAKSKAAADELRAKADSAEAAFIQVQKLQERVSALKSDVQTAREEADKTRKTIEKLTVDTSSVVDAKTMLEREIADLKKELAEARQKLQAATASAAQPVPPAPTP